MSRVLLAVLIAGLLTACGGDDLPPRALCDDAPADATITDIAIGTARALRPLEDGAPTYTETDASGRTLISLRALWRGADAPTCARVTFFVFDPRNGDPLVDEVLQLDSTPIADWKTSGMVFYDASDWPAEVTIEIRIYGMMLRQTHPVGGWEMPDAGF